MERADASTLSDRYMGGDGPGHEPDLLRRGLNLLRGEDRLLLTMHICNGLSFRQISQLTGTDPTSVARRIQRTAERLADGKYIQCLRHRDTLGNREMAVARDYFLLGLPMTRIAAKRNLSYYRVRKTAKKLRRLVAAAENQKSLHLRQGHHGYVQRLKELQVGRPRHRKGRRALPNVRPDDGAPHRAHS